MLERKMSAIAVAMFAAKPLGKEALLRRTFIRRIAPEQRPQHRVGVDPVVEPIDQRIDRHGAADTHKDIAAGEAAMRLGMNQKSTVLHALLVSHWRPNDPYLSSPHSHSIILIDHNGLF